MAGELVLVTGGSGVVGAPCVLHLLVQGYQVRTTIRSLSREEEVREMLRQGGAEPGERLEFFAADLMNDAGWRKPSGAARTCCTWRRRFHPAFPNTKMS